MALSSEYKTTGEVLGGTPPVVFGVMTSYFTL